MNKAFIIGRLTKDPENKDANGTQVTKFTVAVDRRKEGADFISCVAFGKTAEFVSKYFQRGSKIVIEGRIQTGSYEKEGVKHYTTEIVAEAVEFGESKKSKEEQQVTKAAEEWTPIGDQITLPFE